MKRNFKNKDKPVTHSDVLWHFTGGASWIKSKNKQSERLKSMILAYENLCGILKDQELKIGGYHEVIDIIVPRKNIFDNKTKKQKIVRNFREIVKTSPVCCVADIPLKGLKYHSQRYGKFGIGFKRSSLIKAGFNPVFYTLNNQKLISHFYNAQSTLDTSGNVIDMLQNVEAEVEDIKDRISEMESDDFYIDTDVDVSSAIDEAESLQSSVENASSELERALAFIKTFSSLEFDTIYAEREWRSVNPFKFKWTDVVGLIFPESYKGRVQQIIQQLHVPLKVKLFSWEGVEL